MMNLKIATVGLLLLWHSCMLRQAAAQPSTDEETRVVLDSRGWQLVGDLRLPASEGPLPAVLMFNKAAGDRKVYRELAHQLAVRGIASYRHCATFCGWVQPLNSRDVIPCGFNMNTLYRSFLLFKFELAQGYPNLSRLLFLFLILIAFPTGFLNQNVLLY
jgi:hypothetical protein